MSPRVGLDTLEETNPLLMEETEPHFFNLLIFCDNMFRTFVISFISVGYVNEV